MKNFLIILMLTAVSAFGQDGLKYSNFVNDFADVLTDQQESDLNKKMSDFEQTTFIEFTIVTVTSLEGRDVESFTYDLFNSWGVGKQGKNNGLMILIAPNERKWRTEVGYGIEEYITDGYSRLEAEKFFPPHFRETDYYGGIDPLVTSFIAKLGNDTWFEREAEAAKIAKQQALDALHLILYL